jgi:hypothetical protein
MVTMAELKKVKIDAVEEVHWLRERLASYNPERIQELAEKAEREIRDLRKCSETDIAIRRLHH